ncbi:hypothetical protein ACHAXR_011435 [Thalassiosira sp. AJA248-18]
MKKMLDRSLSLSWLIYICCANELMTFLLIIVCVLCSASSVSAFFSPSISYATVRCRGNSNKATLGTTSSIRNNHRDLKSLRLKSDGNPDEEKNPADVIGGDLVTALARLDKEWALARQEDGGKKIGEWAILDLKEDDESSPEIVYLLEPTSGAAPSCVIFFLGGAGLGQFPHISYGEFLQRLAVKMNASVVAIPYEVGLDHFSIAQGAVNRMKKAVIECEDSRGYPSSIPKYAIGHSLGAKLHSIGVAATGIGEELSGLGFVSYNNFGFAETISMAKSFAKELQVGSGGSGFGTAGSAMPFDTLFDLAGMAVSAVGIEFTPSPSEMDRIVKKKFEGEVVKKTRMFQFEDDDLDSTPNFVGCFEEDTEAPSVSYIPGTHLTPVFLKLGLDDLFPEEVKDVASQATGGFQNASFGNEEALDLLVEEVSGWMLGKGPNDRRTARKQIAGIIDAEIEG